MKLLLKLFINQSKDEGYVIPVVFALGLIMTLIGTIAIFQSSDEQLISISKRETSKALAAAEAGVARYREQINKYKVIAMYDACENSADPITGDWGTDTACDNADSDRSWATATKSTAGVANIPHLDLYCPEPGETTANNDDNVEALATRDWRNIGDDASGGQYRLIDYAYTPGILATDDTYDDTLGGRQPIGTLIVEGRVNQQNTNLENEASASVARVEVILPIQPGLPNPDSVVSLDAQLNEVNPVLWLAGASDNTNIDLGDVQVNGNIVVKDGDCNHPGSLPVADDFVNSNENAVILDPRPLPAEDYPTTITLPPDVPSLNDVREITLAELKDISLPLNRLNSAVEESIDIDGDAVYFYRLTAGTDLELTHGEVINIRDDRKVVLFVDGDIRITAGADDIDINPSSLNNSSNLEIYLVNGGNIRFTGEGNVNISAFIHAPKTTVRVLGNPTVNFTGAMWVKDFEGKNLDNAFTINSDDQYLNYTYVSNFWLDNGSKIVDPILFPPARWETQQVN